MPIENAPEVETRELLIGVTPDYVYFGTLPPIRYEELDCLPKPTFTYPSGKQAEIDKSHAGSYPDGQLEVVYPRWAFDGIQHIRKFARQSAEALGGCAVREAIIPILDPRYSLAEHIR